MTQKDKMEPAETVEDLLWRFGEAEFDERSWRLCVSGREVELEPRPLEILAYLLRHAGEVVTKDELLDAIWGRSTETISDKVLTNAVGKLRRALGDEQEAVIATIHRRGYRLVAPATRVVLARRVLPRLDLQPGEAVPGREQWRLLQVLDLSARSEVWLAEHGKTREPRVFKFSPDAARLSSLKREVTLSRVLRESLGERPEYVRVLEWNFEQAPYFIECEYGGLDWPRWAESQGGLAAVPLALRLALFVQAAEAIGAAHGVGVQHKDIKPANLLVAARPAGGWQLRVTDFGSGRLTDPGRLEALGITRLGFTETQNLASDSLTGTPLYLAPELLAGRTPSQASDVYALGVLLYQLVVADFRRPLSAGWERTVEDELLREDIALAAAGDADLRLDSARALAQRLARLAVRRQERAAALRREAEVEQTRQALLRSRQRRPWVLATMVVLVLGLGLSGWLYRRVAQEARVSEAVNDFLQQALISRANPSEAGREGVTVLEALIASEPDIERELAGQPEVAARVLFNLAHAYQGIGAPARAVPVFERALALLAATPGSDDPELFESMVYSAMGLLGQGAAGIGAADRLAAIALPKLPDDAFYRTLSALYRGQRAGVLGDWSEARRQADAALADTPEDARALRLRALAELHGANPEAATATERRMTALLTAAAAGTGVASGRARSQLVEARLELWRTRGALGLAAPEQQLAALRTLLHDAELWLGSAHPASRQVRDELSARGGVATLASP